MRFSKEKKLSDPSFLNLKTIPAFPIPKTPIWKPGKKGGKRARQIYWRFHIGALGKNAGMRLIQAFWTKTPVRLRRNGPFFCSDPIFILCISFVGMFVSVRSTHGASLKTKLIDLLPIRGVDPLGWFFEQPLLNDFSTGDSSFLPTKDRKSTRLNSSHSGESRMPSSA